LSRLTPAATLKFRAASLSALSRCGSSVAPRAFLASCRSERGQHRSQLSHIVESLSHLPADKRHGDGVPLYLDVAG
jgi:hypothetical protein